MRSLHPASRGARPARRLSRAALAVLAVLVALASTACTYSIPLAGTAVGRGAPVGDGVLALGASFGLNPELVGTLPDLNGSNPVPHPDSLTTPAGAFDLFGLTFGVSDAVDVGLSFSRGLHSMVRVANRGPLTVSVSPAIHRYTAEQVPGGKVRVTNLNLTGLVGLGGPAAAGRPLEAYAGAAVNRYHAWLDAPGGRSSRTALTPSGLAGVRLRLPPCLGACAAGSGGRTRGVTVAIEGHAALIRQRDDRRDLVPTLRVYLQVGGAVRRASRFPLTPPPGRG